ncbi:MAG: ABC-type transporter, periplasmic subunit [Candidatus Eremiobacteraeota bacterium]|nr:ABC-type transporter, periplasmic subunit [Candidatus Eremiobacteraeota bacterium]
MRVPPSENGRRVKRLGFLAVALAIALGACTRVATTQSGPGTDAPGGAAGRHPWTRPGVLRLASLSDPDNLSPMIGAYQIDVDLSMFWAGYLFNYDDNNNVVPELATELPTLENGGISRDGLTITYHLRKGVTWHDGAPFGADDVKFSWQAIMNPNNDVQSRIGYDIIASIDTPDPQTAVVKLKKPFAPFVNTFFTMGATPIPVYPKHLLAQYPDLNRIPYNSKPVGTGPFIVKEWHRGQTLRMVANPHYWRGAPKLKEVQYRAIPDENTLTTSVRTHEIDLWSNASSANYTTASNIPDTHVYLTPFTQFSMLGFNVSRPILSEVQVRRALAFATDRKRLLDTITYGVNILGEGDQPAFFWAHDAELKSLPFDPAKARDTLDAAGWRIGADGIRSKNGQPLRLEMVITTGNAVGNRLSVLLQSAWKDVGVELEIKQYASALMFAGYGAGGILQTGKFDIASFSWVNGVDPDDSTLFTSAAIPPHGYNQFRYRNPEVDAQERIALASNDRAVRKKAYARIQEILVDQVPELTTWFQRRFDVASVDLKNYKPSHVVTTFWNTWEYDI